MRRGPGGLMLKALALTRKGSLGDATAAIQKALRLVVADERPVPGVRVKQGSRRAIPAPVASAIDAATRPELATSPAAVDERDDRPTPADRTAHRGPMPTGFVAGRHSFAGVSRDYKLYVPARLAASPWLIVMLHGCTQGSDDFAAGTRMNHWAARDGFLVLYPQQSRSANPSACWNWFQTNDQRRDHGEVGLIASMIRKIVADYGVDATRVYVAGLSAGGAMAANLVAAYPDLFAAAGIHSGLAAGAANNVVDALTAMRSGAIRRPSSPTPGADSRPTPTIVFHGDDDRTVHPQNGDRIVAAAFDGEPPPAEVETGRSPGGQAWEKHSFRDRAGVTRVEQWKLEAAGHAWAGGDAAGTYTDPNGVDATGEMLRFFGAHPL